MSERRCLVCHTLLRGEADCPVCGNPDYILPNNRPETMQKIQKLANDYRESKLDAMEVSICAYSYEMKEDKLVEKDIKMVPICAAKMLSFENIFWLDQRFARIESDREMNLTVVVTKNGRQIKKQDVFFRAPKLTDFWYLGAYLTEGLGVGFAIGNRTNHVKTDSISLI